MQPPFALSPDSEIGGGAVALGRGPSVSGPNARSRNRRRWMIVLGLVGVAALLGVWITWTNREPRYSGRTVTEWASALNSPDRTTRSNATDALRAIGPEAIPALVRALRDHDSWLKRTLTEQAPGLPLRLRRWFLRTFNPFKPAEQRLAAARALALFGTNVPAEPLARALHDPERQVAAEAATTLGGLGAAAVPSLIRSSADADDHVRSMACYALSIMRPPPSEAIPALIARLGDAQRNIREQAVYALGMQGQAALPALRDHLEDPDPLLRSNAAVALRTIESGLGQRAAPGLSRGVMRQ